MKDATVTLPLSEYEAMKSKLETIEKLLACKDSEIAIKIFKGDEYVFLNRDETVKDLLDQLYHYRSEYLKYESKVASLENTLSKYRRGFFGWFMD